MRCKCQFLEGARVSFGDIPLDPCHYALKEIHKNVTVEIYQCDKCGAVDISWKKQDDTESVILGHILDVEE